MNLIFRKYRKWKKEKHKKNLFSILLSLCCVILSSIFPQVPSSCLAFFLFYFIFLSYFIFYCCFPSLTYILVLFLLCILPPFHLSLSPCMLSALLCITFLTLSPLFYCLLPSCLLPSGFTSKDACEIPNIFLWREVKSLFRFTLASFLLTGGTELVKGFLGSTRLTHISCCL